MKVLILGATGLVGRNALAQALTQSMGRQIVMQRGKPTGQVGTIGIGGRGHWQVLCRPRQLRRNNEEVVIAFPVPCL